MFNTSLRRVARTCSHASPAASRSTTPSVASFSSHAHQRRHSSSKPPVPPNNGSSAIPAASVKQVGAPRSETKRPAAESRSAKKRSSKDKLETKQESQADWTSKLPSVPSLQHLNPKDIYVASFFSTHRPVSITGPVPPETSIEAIDKIFQPKLKSKAHAAPHEVIYTLASAVEHLDEQIASKQGDHQAQSVEQKAAIIKALMQRNENPADPNRTVHLDAIPNGGNVRLVIQEIARRFRPFNVPPPPTPITDAEIDAAQAVAEADTATAEANEEMQARTLQVEIEQQDQDPYIQQVVFNIPQETDMQNGGFFTSQGAPTIEMEIEDTRGVQEIQDPTFGRGLGGRRNVTRRRPGMYAISVKRQRRMKMKKHKYKKLMRKTRNLRRKLGQI